MRYPRIAAEVLTEQQSARAARLLWGVMTTETQASGYSLIYERFPSYLDQNELDRRRPVVDEMLGLPAGAKGPRAILRHDCDDALDLDRWAEWESRRGIHSVTLLRAPVAADGRRPEYLVAPPNYDVEEDRIGRFVEEGRARGCEFGLHYSSPHPTVVRAELARLRAATGLAPPLPASAHYLQSSGATLRALDELGVSHDFSFMDFASYAGRAIPPGVPAHPGFPTGTTHAHLMWDPLEGRWLRLVAVPGALEEEFVAGRCPTAPSDRDIGAYLDLFAQHNGLLVLNWHTDRWELVSFLEALVEELQQRGFTFITTADLRPQVPPESSRGEVTDPRVTAPPA